MISLRRWPKNEIKNLGQTKNQLRKIERKILGKQKSTQEIATNYEHIKFTEATVLPESPTPVFRSPHPIAAAPFSCISVKGVPAESLVHQPDAGCVTTTRLTWPLWTSQQVSNEEARYSYVAARRDSDRVYGDDQWYDYGDGVEAEWEACWATVASEP